jgi:hypothetical protein
LKPLPELEAMHAGAEDNDAKEFFAGHGSFLERGGGNTRRFRSRWPQR